MLPTELSEDLEIAAIDAIRGDPPGPAVARRLEFAIRDVLILHNLSKAKVIVSSNQSGTTVVLLLPAPKNRVTEVKIRLQ